MAGDVAQDAPALKAANVDPAFCQHDSCSEYHQKDYH
jgi:hypothetical protein